MRFITASAELGYVRRLSAALPQAMFQCSCLTGLSAAGVLATHSHGPSAWQTEMGFRVYLFVTTIFAVLVVLATTIAALSRARPDILASRPLAREALAVLLVSVIMFLPMCLNSHYQLVVLGLEESDLTRPGDNGDAASHGDMHSDSATLLVMNLALAASHLALPIRWCSLLYCEVTSVMVYGICVFGLGSGEGFSRSSRNLIYHICLVLVTALGKRRVELQDRKSYMKIAVEVTKRAQAEYQLESVQVSLQAQSAQRWNGGRGRGDEEPSGGVISGENASDDMFSHETHGTGRVFGGAGKLQDIEQRLEMVVAIGFREHWLIAEEDLELCSQSVLGTGSFGAVVAASLHGTPVVVKLPLWGMKADDSRYLDQVCNELRILRHVRHPNIVQFHGACVSRREIVLVLELVEGTPLSVIFKRPGEELWPDGPKRFKIVSGISRALRYLHASRPRIVHGDLKDSNIIVERLQDDLRAKLLDFGLSRLLKAGARPLGGTLQWMSPEVMNEPQKPPDPAADVFSFGRLVFFVTTSVRPMEGVKGIEIKRLAKAGQLPPLLWPDSPEHLGCRELVERCLQVDPQSRPSSSEVYDELMRIPGAEAVATHETAVKMSLHDGIQDVRNRLKRQEVSAPRAAHAMQGPHERQGDWWKKRMCQKSQRQGPQEIRAAAVSNQKPNGFNEAFGFGDSSI